MNSHSVNTKKLCLFTVTDGNSRPVEMSQNTLLICLIVFLYLTENCKRMFLQCVTLVTTTLLLCLAKLALSSRGDQSIPFKNFLRTCLIANCSSPDQLMKFEATQPYYMQVIECYVCDVRLSKQVLSSYLNYGLWLYRTYP